MKIKLSNYFVLPYWIPLCAIALRVASAPTASLSYFVLAAYALQGRVQTIQALTLSWLFSMLNTGVAPDAGAAGIGRYVVLAAATITALRLGLRDLPMAARSIVWYTLIIGFGFFIHSIFFSAEADVSVLKVLSWMMATGSLIMTWGGLSAQVRDLLMRQIFGLLILVLVFSLPLVFLPAGFMVNGTGFQGVLGHPQAFGAVMCLLAAWSGSAMLASNKPSWWLIGQFILALIMIVMSEARTGLLSLLLGLAISVISISGLTGKRLLFLVPGLSSIRLGMLAIASVVLIGMNWSSFSERMEDFFTKRTDSQSLAESYKASRGELVDTMLENINKDPFFGIGFGIGSIPSEMIIIRDPFLNLPVSAIIEKGVLPVAILEELGIFGFVATSIWLIIIIQRSTCGGFVPLAVCLTALLLNMGDSMFFSASGMGLILIILVAWAATFTTKRATQV
jgi:O-antigen ligase